MNFLRQSLNSSESSQPLRNPQQITCVTLKGFRVLSENPVFNRQYQADGMATKIKRKMQACFTLYSKFWEGTSVKSIRYSNMKFYSDWYSRHRFILIFIFVILSHCP